MTLRIALRFICSILRQVEETLDMGAVLKSNTPEHPNQTSNSKPIYTQFIFMYFEMDVIRFYYFSAKEFRTHCFSIDSHSIRTNQLPIYLCSSVHAENFTWQIKRANILTCLAYVPKTEANMQTKNVIGMSHACFWCSLMKSFRRTEHTNVNGGWQQATHQIIT